jgi:hypothetical protein
MMCAAVAGQRRRRVLLREHYHKIGEKKIRVGEKIRVRSADVCLQRRLLGLACRDEQEEFFAVFESAVGFRVDFGAFSEVSSRDLMPTLCLKSKVG